MHSAETVEIQENPQRGTAPVPRPTLFQRLKRTVFVEDLIAVLVPQRKWHYLFHLLVMAVASTYWLASHSKLPEASWAEIAMYRPNGDNQVFPAIAALSQGNFGDPTDALHHGKGTAGTQVVVLFPYVLATALFGAAGYMVADVFLAWTFFVALLMLLRRCNFSNFSSLLVGSAIATRSMQILCAKFGESFGALLSVSDLMGTWEWGFPNLLDLHLFVQRIPRPMGTEMFLVLLLYFLVRQWHEMTVPSMKRGVAIGALLALLMQGDPFTLSAVGLVMLYVVGRTVVRNGWQWPWRFAGGLLLGALVFGSYFLWQRVFEQPDAAVRFGLADYPRNKIMFLPGYGPLLRVGVVCLLAALVALAARRANRENGAAAEAASRAAKTTKRNHRAASDEAAVEQTPSLERSVASFFVILMVAGWIAQPVQLLLLGKGSQIYHYLLFTLPLLYSYSVVILLFNLFKLATSPEVPALIRRLGERPHWTGAIVLVFVLGWEALVGMENKMISVSVNTNPRRETHLPWSHVGNAYRPNFRALEKAFREIPELQQARTFATLNYEVNFLLAGFYGKRAYLPDNAYSTLSDAELEERFCEVLSIMQLPQGEFPAFAQITFILNYWLGCAKYWFTSDYQYSTQTDYTEKQWSDLQQQAKQSPWILCLPQSESARLSQKYAEIVQRNSPKPEHPDALIVGLEKGFGMVPKPEWYREVYTNELFSVYVKNSAALSKL